MKLIKDLEAEELPFINAKVGGSLIDFEKIPSTVTYGAYRRNSVIGSIGPMPISKNQSVSMMWETGKAVVSVAESNFCNFDGSDCYTARTLPVIFSISAN